MAVAAQVDRRRGRVATSLPICIFRHRSGDQDASRLGDCHLLPGNLGNRAPQIINVFE